MAPKANLFARDVESIDPVQRIATLSPGTRPASMSIHYDHLVIAMGTRMDYSKISRERPSRNCSGICPG
jgi:NADH dehydrogenase FAD-containing subunit